MDTDAEKTLRERVRKALGLTEIEDAFWQDAVGTGHVEEAADPGRERAFKSLTERIQQLRERFQPNARAIRRWVRPTFAMDDSLSPYLMKMAEALGHREVDAETGWREPIVMYMEHGRLVVEAEPWVPAKNVDRAFRELQWLALDDTRNRSISLKALDRYLWIKRQRERLPDAGWRKHMAAWNRHCAGTGRYDSVRNFHKDFDRTEQFLGWAAQLGRTVKEWETGSPPTKMIEDGPPEPWYDPSDVDPDFARIGGLLMEKLGQEQDKKPPPPP